mmetsp:Transcript_7995/g.16124  ORF Transcript_7995/g.16124 Transcript_7995/m.16124 type:complete len:1418 (-) Transcript_7995:13-4266(-)
MERNERRPRPSRHHRATTNRKLSFSNFHIKQATIRTGLIGTPSPPTPRRKFSFSHVRKVNQFNFVVGAATNKRRDEMKDFIKEKIAVKIDPSTLAILGTLNVDPKRPAEGKLKKKTSYRENLGVRKSDLTPTQRFEIARKLALKYTRDVHTLNTFEALEEDRRKLMVLRSALAEERDRSARAAFESKQRLATMDESSSESNGEDESELVGYSGTMEGSYPSPKTSKIVARFSSIAKQPLTPPQSKRKQSSMILMKSPLERQVDQQRTSQRQSRASFQNVGISFSSPQSDSREKCEGNQESRDRKERRSISPKRQSISPARFAARRSISPARSTSRRSISPARSSISPTPSGGKRKPTLALNNGRVQIMSNPNPSHQRKSISPNEPETDSKMDKSRLSFHRSSNKSNYSSRSSYRKASSISAQKQESDMTEEGYHRCSLDDKSTSSDDDSFFRELDGDKGDSAGGRVEEEDMVALLNLKKDNNEHYNGGNYNDVRDDLSCSSISTSSSASSMMVDIDIVQSRLLQKQAVKAAAEAERKKDESKGGTRKRKADPMTCAGQAVVLLPNYQLGDSWVEKFASLMGPRVKNIDLSNSNISKLGVNALFRSFLPSLKRLTLKQVDLSQSMVEIERFFSNEDKCNLVELNIPETKLGNINCAKLCTSLSLAATVTSLDLSGNMISSVGCEAIAKMLEKVHLQRLSLAWNKVDGQAAASLFKALANHGSLLALDVSWNAIGTFPTAHKASIEGMTGLCRLISENKSLFHLNLSANKFSENDCKKLSNVLETNQSICGLHFDHNPLGRVDTKGYLHVLEQGEGDTENNMPGHKKKSTFHSHHQKKISSHSKSHRLAFEGSTCWCCGQWVEVEFEFTQPWVDEKAPEDVYLRLSIDNWRKDKMVYEGGCRWTLSRMVPRVTITYCFSLGKGDWSTDIFCPEQPKCLDSGAPTSTVNFLSLEEIDIVHADVEFERHYEPCINGHYQEENVVWPFFSEVLPMHVVHLDTAPRMGGWADENTAAKWTLESSRLFGARKKENAVNSFWDTENLINKAFTSDWGYLAPKLAKMRLSSQDIEALGDFISKHYRRLCTLYKRNVILHQNKTFALSMIVFEQFLSSCDIADGDVVKKRDIDRIFISTTSEKAKSKLHQQNGLERFEFVEALIRCAKLKFLDSKAKKQGSEAARGNVSEAFHSLFSDHLKFCYYVDPDVFRKEHFYLSECERILTVHVHNIRTIFNQYALISGGSRGRLMSIQEFHVFIDHSGLAERGALTHDEAAICFVEAKFTTPDEIKSVEHHSITFISFLECICRMAFQVDSNMQMKNKTFGFDFGDIIMEAQKRTKFRGVLIDEFMTKLVIGLRESGQYYFNRTLKVNFSDEEAAMKKCANVVIKFVRNWRTRRKERLKKEGLDGRKTFRAAIMMAGMAKK